MPTAANLVVKGSKVAHARQLFSTKRVCEYSSTASIELASVMAATSAHFVISLCFNKVYESVRAGCGNKMGKPAVLSQATRDVKHNSEHDENGGQALHSPCCAAGVVHNELRET